VIGDERSVERDDRVPAPREPPGVEPDAVVHRPRDERQRGRERDGTRPAETVSPGGCDRERERGEDDQDGIPGPNERE
jgi:hypothetical protein